MKDKKTKVIAVRVTEDEYAVITGYIGKMVGLDAKGVIRAKTVGDVVRHFMRHSLETLLEQRAAEVKKAEAKAKRQAKKEAQSGI